ncbi:MAG: flagellar biosynthetic protein FliR [Armatimonadetes bacterium]|nr:flagellar biosynthetic protein FliR [Armatimonadota bacterium]
MSLDSELLIAFLAAFLRTSAMVLAAPLFSASSVPVTVRVFFALVLSLALTPLLHGVIPVPDTLYGLVSMGFHEIVTGLLIGMVGQLVLLAAEIAGSFLDMHIGLGLASVLAPNVGIPSSVIGKFKFMLALVLFLTMNGHHLLINALIASYQVTAELSLQATFDVALISVGRMFMLALQIAAPVAAVAFVVDAAFGIISRAVPQINVLMAGISGKLLVGFVALSFALPGLAYGVTRGLEMTEDLLLRLFQG